MYGFLGDVDVILRNKVRGDRRFSFIESLLVFVLEVFVRVFIIFILVCVYWVG